MPHLGTGWKGGGMDGWRKMYVPSIRPPFQPSVHLCTKQTDLVQGMCSFLRIGRLGLARVRRRSFLRSSPLPLPRFMTNRPESFWRTARARRLLFVGLVAVLVWIAFFDSHSLLRRAGFSNETDRLEEENRMLRAEIERIEAELARPLSDDEIEQVARERYGMRRPGETIYRVEPSPPEDR